jgi:thymidylate synthase (FAD)
MTHPINDSYFRVEVLSQTERPNLLSYLAMHQCYSEKVIIDEIAKLSTLSESELGKRVVDKCLKFGHFSVIEHPHITFCVSGFPHNVMAQATRHRLLSFSVQSQRYTGDRISKLAHIIRRKAIGDKLDMSCREAIESVFYIRSQGTYHDRNGNKYEYTINDWSDDVNTVIKSTLDYDDRICKGWSPEHARDMLIQNIRQDFVVTFNARSLLHFCDLRLPSDAQLEIRTLAQMLFEKFSEWMPECAEWYSKHRYAKNKLSP